MNRGEFWFLLGVLISIPLIVVGNLGGHFQTYEVLRIVAIICLVLGIFLLISYHFRKHRYFVTYLCSYKDGFTIGNVESFTQEKITNSNELRKLEKQLRKELNVDQLAILVFREFD